MYSTSTLPQKIKNVNSEQRHCLGAKEKGRVVNGYQLTKLEKSHKIQNERIFLNDSSEAIYSPVTF